MIGNKDWSLAYQHNTEMFFDGRRMIAIPYDFDHSGLVNAFYAKPNPMLKISSVTERVYRGLCKRDPQTFNNMRNLYISKEGSILNILNGFKENIEDNLSVSGTPAVKLSTYLKKTILINKMVKK